MYIQKHTPTPNKLMNFSLRDFDGGLNNRSDQLEDNEARDIKDMIFADDTVMEKRFGQTYYDVLDLTDAVTFIDEYRPYDDTDKLVRATDDVVYLDSTQLTTVAGRIDAENFQGKYFILDGDKIRVYGKFAQSTTTYEEVTGTPNPNYVLMEVVNPPQGYTPLDNTHSKGVLQIDYTNSKVWYEPCQLELDDTYKGANVLPEKPKYLVGRDGRLYVSGSDKDDDNVFITDVSNPFYFPVSLPLQLPPNSDKVSGMIVYDDAVVVGRHEDIYVIRGKTNNPELGFEMFELKKLNTHTGFNNNQSIKVAHNYLFFLGRDGNAYSLASVREDERVLATTIISKKIDFEKEPIGVTMAEFYEASTYFYKDEWYVAVADKVLIYSYRHRAWTLCTDFYATSFYNLNDTLIWGKSNGRTVKFAEDYLDFGKPFEAYWKSKYFDMGEASNYKMFREFYLVAHTYNDYKSDINVTFEIDYADVSGRATITNQIAIFGRAVWGDRFISRNIVESLPFIIGRRGRAISFKFSNGYSEDGVVATKDDLYTYLEKKNGMLLYVTDESKYYLFYDYEWTALSDDDLNQSMKIYQVNGDYELRGKR